MSVLPICIFSLDKCLCKSFGHDPVGYVFPCFKGWRLLMYFGYKSFFQIEDVQIFSPLVTGFSLQVFLPFYRQEMVWLPAFGGGMGSRWKLTRQKWPTATPWHTIWQDLVPALLSSITLALSGQLPLSLPLHLHNSGPPHRLIPKASTRFIWCVSSHPSVSKPKPHPWALRGLGLGHKFW